MGLCLGCGGRVRVVARVIGAGVEGERVVVEGLRVSVQCALAIFAAELASGVVLLAVSARVVFHVPGVLVPFTLQTLANAGNTSVWCEGLAGCRSLCCCWPARPPVFALGGGLDYVASPTFGYLLGFIAASYLAGRSRAQQPLEGSWRLHWQY